METKKKSQAPVLLMLLGIIISETLALQLPSGAEAWRNVRQLDEISTTDFSSPMSQLSAQKYLASLVGKQASDDIPEYHGSVKRHTVEEILKEFYEKVKTKEDAQKFLDLIFKKTDKEEAE